MVLFNFFGIISIDGGSTFFLLMSKSLFKIHYVMDAHAYVALPLSIIFMRKSRGWKNSPLRARFFKIKLRARPGTLKKLGAQNQSQWAHLIEKKPETTIFVLCYINSACSFHFCCISIKNVCNKAFAVLMLFNCLTFPYVSENNSHTSDASV